ncbi:hypothetical protein EDB89DRAFT_1903642 [Lactarius sanguifluus]|nr:hypothetical protein EDB89DRAFT_1903642 [Lactarius sanguifluus]
MGDKEHGSETSGAEKGVVNPRPKVGAMGCDLKERALRAPPCGRDDQMCQQACQAQHSGWPCMGVTIGGTIPSTRQAGYRPHHRYRPRNANSLPGNSNTHNRQEHTGLSGVVGSADVAKHVRVIQIIDDSGECGFGYAGG